MEGVFQGNGLKKVLYFCGVLAFIHLSFEFDAKYNAFKNSFQCYFSSSSHVLSGAFAMRERNEAQQEKCD